MHTHIHYLKPNQSNPINFNWFHWNMTNNDQFKWISRLWNGYELNLSFNWNSNANANSSLSIDLIWFYLQIPKEKRKFSIKTRFKRITSNWIEYGWSFSSWIFSLHIGFLFWVSVCRFNEFHLQSAQTKEDNTKTRTNKPLNAMQCNSMKCMQMPIKRK